MKLEKNEYTIKGLISHLNKKWGGKVNGKPFNHNDISQYLLRGYIPYRYGGDEISVQEVQGVKVITLTKRSKIQ